MRRKEKVSVAHLHFEPRLPFAAECRDRLVQQIFVPFANYLCPFRGTACRFPPGGAGLKFQFLCRPSFCLNSRFSGCVVGQATLMLPDAAGFIFSVFVSGADTDPGSRRFRTAD
jgi:hypothetical protein